MLIVWLFIGTTNIPKITEVPDLRNELRKARESLESVPPIIRRLVKDGYICFYSNPDIPQFNVVHKDGSAV